MTGDDARLSLTRRGALLSAAGTALLPAGALAQAIGPLNPLATRIQPETKRAAAADHQADPPPDGVEDPFTLPTATDGSRRLSVPVMLDDRGPFPFIVDTGADHSILSAELAAALMLPPGPPIRVHSIEGSNLFPTARVRSLVVGNHAVERQSLALLPRRGLGAPGLLGLDAVADQRVTLDFVRREMSVRRSVGFPFDPDAVVVRAAKRSGQLLLVDSTVRSEPVFVILDTGAEVTIANSALRALETRRRRRKADRDLETVRVISVTGDTREGLADTISEITLEGVRLRGAAVTWSDLHVFSRFGVADQPAVLLGMDVLRAFDRVEIDFGRRQIGFVLPKGAG